MAYVQEVLQVKKVYIRINEFWILKNLIFLTTNQGIIEFNEKIIPIQHNER